MIEAYNKGLENLVAFKQPLVEVILLFKFSACSSPLSSFSLLPMFKTQPPLTTTNEALIHPYGKDKSYGGNTWGSSPKSKELWIRQQNGDFSHHFDRPLWPLLLHSLPRCRVYSFSGTYLTDPFHDFCVRYDIVNRNVYLASGAGE